ncbi:MULTISPECIES: aminoacyl--tRNA ligase-related protein [unclassified Haladaptatus]|uniref:aminoacyl--tRNA ligase-related protein n=1 Tax=unclassified Haladaptatus TaxID=2622732 RepID=UPI0023E7EF22|nr:MULTISPECIES: aminoacyl--tRNA ligase-related protein [unclassified Haladaptatus]
MRRSKTLLFTRRDTDTREWDNETVQLTLRAGLVRQFGGGLYGFTPTGERVRQHLIDRIHAAMTAIGGQAISLPQLQYRDIWERSGRWANFEDEMFTLQNRDGQDMCLAPSHEEGVVHLCEGFVRSYEDLPLLLYQISTKHRDDHPRNGLLRTKEFTMKDAYSLHASHESLDEWYDRVQAAYCSLFEGLGIDFVVASADNSVMGGNDSEEFIAPVESGTVELVYCETTDCRFGITDESPRNDLTAGNSCPTCGNELIEGEGIEIGHVFKLGTRYADAMDFTIDVANGSKQSVVMGSYGIGVERLIHTLLAQRSDEAGCRWPAETMAPYAVSIIPLQYEGEIREAADRLHEELGVSDTILFDDDRQSIGERFTESDLLGIPLKVVLGNHFLETGEVELETRDGDKAFVELDEVTGLRG